MNEEAIKKELGECFKKLRETIATEIREQALEEAWIAFGFIFDTGENSKKDWREYIDNGWAAKCLVDSGWKP